MISQQSSRNEKDAEVSPESAWSWMETKRSTAVEETVVTPASSPTSCEDVCSRGEDSDGFVSLMDEDGIIGLLEALEIVGVEEYGANVESDLKVPSGPLTETQLDEAGYHRGGSLSHRRSPGEDAQTLPPSPGEIWNRLNFKCGWSVIT